MIEAAGGQDGGADPDVRRRHLLPQPPAENDAPHQHRVVEGRDHRRWRIAVSLGDEGHAAGSDDAEGEEERRVRPARSEERRGGEEGGRTGRTGGAGCNRKTKKKKKT